MRSYTFLMESAVPELKFKNGDRVKISRNIRCIQCGHEAVVCGHRKHEKYGYDIYDVKIDDPEDKRFNGNVYSFGDSYLEKI